MKSGKAGNPDDNPRSEVRVSFATGVIALVFLIVGYQGALFVGKFSLANKIMKGNGRDTVYIYRDKALDDAPREADDVPREAAAPSGRQAPKPGGGRSGVSRSSEERATSEAIKADRVFRDKGTKVESFRFNPNTATPEELVRLGFSPKQAQSIDNYRKKGGRFRKREDFAKSYVVSDSIYRRLEPFIDIPKLDLNTADSAALDALPGIGGYFARKIIEYRGQLGGYSCKEQLMEIYHFDEQKYDKLKDLVYVSERNSRPLGLWTLPVDSLALHPYIGNRRTAGAIVLFRNNSPQSEWSIESLRKATIISGEQANRLSRCRIAPPQ